MPRLKDQKVSLVRRKRREQQILSAIARSEKINHVTGRIVFKKRSRHPDRLYSACLFEKKARMCVFPVILRFKPRGKIQMNLFQETFLCSVAE